MTQARRYAIKEAATEFGHALYWNFTAWRADAPERLLDAESASRELARLQASLPHAAERMSIIDVVELRRRAARFGELRQAILLAVGYDKLPKGEARSAIGRACVALAKQAQEAEERALDEQAIRCTAA
jgi:hypothetical protein